MTKKHLGIALMATGAVVYYAESSMNLMPSYIPQLVPTNPQFAQNPLGQIVTSVEDAVSPLQGILGTLLILGGAAILIWG